MSNKIVVRPDDSLPSLPPEELQNLLREEEVDFREYVSVVRRRWLPMLLVAGAVFSLVALNTMRQRKVYDAASKLVVVTSKGTTMRSAAAGSGVMGELADLRQARDVDTQAEIVNSPDLLEKAYQKLPLDERRRGFGSETFPGWPVAATSKTETDIINVTAHAYQPQAAADLANAVAETYLDEDRIQNSQATRQAREYVQRERDRTDKDLAAASTELAQFKRSSGLVAMDAQASGLASKRIELRNAYDTAQGELRAAHERLGVVEGQIHATAPQIDFATTTAQNPEFSLVQAQIVQLEGQLAQQAQEFTPTSIEITQLRTQLREQQDRLRNLSQTIVSSKQTELNPLRQKLLQDFADAKAGEVMAEARSQALSTQLGRLEKDLKGYPEQERRLADLQQRVDVLSRTFNMLSDRYYSLLIDERSSIPSGLIAARARPSGAPSSPKTTLNLAFGLVLALACGLGVGVLLERLDAKAHTPADVEKLYGISSLALIPEAKSTSGDPRLLIGGVEPNHAFTEGFRLLRNNIGFLSPDDPVRVLGVTSAAMGEGKSTTSVNLAIAMAMDGKRVLLIDADLRRPTIHAWMDQSNDVGFSSVVRGLTKLEEAIRPSPYEGVSCLTSGPLPPDPTEFLNSRRSHELFERARELYDVVIVDAPPCTGLSDTQIISTMVDGVLVVAALDRTPKPLTVATVRLLRQANAHLLGLVVNRVKNKGGAYGYYGYYGYEQDAPRLEAGSKGRRSKEIGSGKA